MRKESAVLLNPRSGKYFRIGGRPTLTREDLLGALSYGNASNKYYRALSVFTGGEEDIERLADPWLLGDISVVALKDGWVYKKGELKMMCLIAAGELYNSKLFAEGRTRHEAMGVSAQEYRHKYQKYYEQIYNIAIDLVREAMTRAIRAYEDRE